MKWYTKTNHWYSTYREVRAGKVFAMVQSATSKNKVPPYFEMKFRVGRHTFVLTTLRGWGKS